MTENPKHPLDMARSKISQGFHPKHDGWDIVPFYRKGDGTPPDVYPMFSGRAVGIQDTDPLLGKGMRVETRVWPHLAAYLGHYGLRNATVLEILYWHFLSVTDKDGTVSQGTALGVCGNTGKVFSGGQPVPDSEKGKPPYRGLHLHMVTRVNGKAIDPDIILNYRQPISMDTKYELVRVEGTGEYGIMETTKYTIIYHRCVDLEDLAFAGRKFGVQTGDLNQAKTIKL